jgi:hypothetical protein
MEVGTARRTQSSTGRCPPTGRPAHQPPAALSVSMALRYSHIFAARVLDAGSESSSSVSSNWTMITFNSGMAFARTTIAGVPIDKV